MKKSLITTLILTITLISCSKDPISPSNLGGINIDTYFNGKTIIHKETYYVGIDKQNNVAVAVVGPERKHFDSLTTYKKMTFRESDGILDLTSDNMEHIFTYHVSGDENLLTRHQRVSIPLGKNVFYFIEDQVFEISKFTETVVELSTLGSAPTDFTNGYKVVRIYEVE